MLRCVSCFVGNVTPRIVAALIHKRLGGRTEGMLVPKNRSKTTVCRYGNSELEYKYLYICHKTWYRKNDDSKYYRISQGQYDFITSRDTNTIFFE